jgi:hypothetical protein
LNRRHSLSCFSIVLVLNMSGCTTYAPSIPANYAGPTAYLDDSTVVHSGSKADFFVVEQVDGANVDNALIRTLRGDQGRGMSMTPRFASRQLIAERPLKVLVKARTHYAAPILALTGTVFQVKGTVEFTPKANAQYVVKGELGETYSAVWIEDVATNTTVGQKVEVKGSAKLGLLEK